jgi:hypothetical protein
MTASSEATAAVEFLQTQVKTLLMPQKQQAASSLAKAIKSITGSPGDDTIYAQAGNDIINGPFGNNRIASRPRQQPRHHR